MEQNQQVLDLLNKMEANSRKQLVYSRIQCAFCLIAAACCAVLLLTVLKLVPQLQALTEQADIVMTNLETVTEELTKLDLEAMVENIDSLVGTSQGGVSSAIEKLEQIDIDTLNEAISDLSDVIEPLAKVANRFK